MSDNRELSEEWLHETIHPLAELCADKYQFLVTHALQLNESFVDISLQRLTEHQSFLLKTDFLKIEEALLNKKSVLQNVRENMLEKIFKQIEEPQSLKKNHL